jgi:hypothetical protein
MKPGATAEALSQLATKADLRGLEQRMIIKFGGITGVAVGVISAGVKFLHCAGCRAGSQRDFASPDAVSSSAASREALQFGEIEHRGAGHSFVQAAARLEHFPRNFGRGREADHATFGGAAAAGSTAAKAATRCTGRCLASSGCQWKPSATTY